MADPSTPTEPLINAREETAVQVDAPSTGGRSTRAYKVAGLTLLACVLIMGQGMIVYFLYSQKGDIQSLQEQSNKMNKDMTNDRNGGSVPMRMHIPMNAMPKLMDLSTDEEASTGSTEKSDPAQRTICQQESSGEKPVSVPGFRPQCDERGLYRAEQCFMKQCWCASPENGEVIPGTLTSGRANCFVPVFTGGAPLALSDTEA